MKKCPYCGRINEDLNITCSRCCAALSQKNENESSEHEEPVKVTNAKKKNTRR